MRITLLVATIGALLLFPTCGGGGGGDEDAKSFASVREVIAALEKHTLTNEHKPRVGVGTNESGRGTAKVDMFKHTLFGAQASVAFDVEPGGYEVEIFVYQDGKTAAEYSEDLGSTASQIQLEGNVALLLHSDNEADLARLVADLRD